MRAAKWGHKMDKQFADIDKCTIHMLEKHIMLGLIFTLTMALRNMILMIRI